MSRSSVGRTAVAALLLASPLLLQAAAPAYARAQTAAQTAASKAAPDSAPESEVSSGQRVTGHTRTHKAHNVKTSPEQPAPATAQKIMPSQRLADEPNQIKDQVAPAVEAPVKPGTHVAPGADTPK